ncbi:TPA: hypothetical protein ACGSIL_004476, partial [Escherichia coli]
ITRFPSGPQLTKARKFSDNQKKRAAKKEAALQKEEEKNKGLEQLADQFALEKQPFIDALAIAGKSPEQQRKCLWTT